MIVRPEVGFSNVNYKRHVRTRVTSNLEYIHCKDEPANTSVSLKNNTMPVISNFFVT